MDMFGIIAVVIVLAVVGIEYFKPGTILKKKNQKKTVRKSRGGSSGVKEEDV